MLPLVVARGEAKRAVSAGSSGTAARVDRAASREPRCSLRSSVRICRVTRAAVSSSLSGAESPVKNSARRSCGVTSGTTVPW